MDLSPFKLGKVPFAPEAKNLRLATYLDKGKLVESARVPAASDWSRMPTRT